MRRCTLSVPFHRIFGGPDLVPLRHFGSSLLSGEISSLAGPGPGPSCPVPPILYSDGTRASINYKYDKILSCAVKMCVEPPCPSCQNVNHSFPTRPSPVPRPRDDPGNFYLIRVNWAVSASIHWLILYSSCYLSTTSTLGYADGFGNDAEQLKI